MTRRKVYETVWKLGKRIKKLEKEEDQQEFNDLLSDLNQGIYGWEQDIKRSTTPYYIRNTFLAGDPITWTDDDLADDDDDSVDKPDDKA